MKTIRIRRKKNQTDYGKRLKLLKSGIPRIVFRKTNKYIIAQYTESKEAQDSVVFGLTSKELLKNGWPESAKGGLKSITASYLLGYLVGKKIVKDKLARPVIDFGLLRVLHKTKVYGFIKGLQEAGVEIKCDEKFLPEEDRLIGEHLKNKVDVEAIKKNIDKK